MLHINDLSLRVGGKLLLEGATLHVPAGQRVGLVGRNGAGKTSLLRLITIVMFVIAGKLHQPLLERRSGDNINLHSGIMLDG